MILNNRRFRNIPKDGLPFNYEERRDKALANNQYIVRISHRYARNCKWLKFFDELSQVHPEVSRSWSFELEPKTPTQIESWLRDADAKAHEDYALAKEEADKL